MLKLDAFGKMSESEQRSALEKVTTGKPNGAVSSLHKRIAGFEARYEMSSDEMRAAYKSGNLSDTLDTSEWLMLLRVRDSVAR